MLNAHTAPEQLVATRAQAAAATARVERARALLRQAQLDLEHTAIRAPSRGVVSKKSVEIGQVIQPGQPLMALVSMDEVWVTGNFKETQLANMRPGQRVVLTVDAYGHPCFGDYTFNSSLLLAGAGPSRSILRTAEPGESLFETHGGSFHGTYSLATPRSGFLLLPGFHGGCQG